MTTNSKLMIVFNDMSLGGIQKKTLDIIRYVQKHQNRKIIICLRNKKGIFLKQLPKNVTCVSPKFHTAKFDMFWFIFWLIIQIYKYHPRRILSFMDLGSIPTILSLRFLFWRKVKVTIGEDILTSKYVYTETFPKLRLYLIKLFYPQADNILVQTTAQKNDLCRIIGNKISPKIIK